MIVGAIKSSNLNNQQIRQELAYAYYLLGMMGMDDQTYGHLSARVPGESSYYIYPLGLLFKEVTPDKLIKVSLTGEILEGTETNYNQTGYVIHSSIYGNRPDINAVFHLHTIAGVAVSAMSFGLLPISQFSYHFYNRIGYHDYNALSLEVQHHGSKLVKDLGPHKAMLLRNHGTLTCGGSIHEAFCYTQFLEKACQVQVSALSAGRENLNIPSHDSCESAYHDMTNFEEDIGRRDFEALIRTTQFPWKSKNGIK